MAMRPLMYFVLPPFRLGEVSPRHGLADDILESGARDDKVENLLVKFPHWNRDGFPFLILYANQFHAIHVQQPDAVIL